MGTQNFGKGALLLAGGFTADVQTITDATKTLDARTYAGRTILLNRAAGQIITLPRAYGTGHVYTFHVLATYTGAAAINTAGATDFFRGHALLAQDSADTAVLFSTANTGTVATESDSIDMFETSNTTGGMIGATYMVQDIATAIWRVFIVSDAGGTEATPFVVS